MIEIGFFSHSTPSRRTRRDAVKQVLADLMGRQAEAQTELVRVVAANTEALRAVSQELRWCKERNLASGATREGPRAAWADGKET